ncbi:hypothetical protein NUZ5A_20387 [Candidatus Nitrosotenuis uzonensis]|uniref:Uncharacterized protein n=1 Tax=Candidatus Nitrosotenuis uzonensis TaxID=1407055 RepID=A0A812F4L5_9ARCH|nr:hypothetical protein NUZ5A_20387 [Candidatus Nitrosotenuis uzonensis]
MTSNANNTVFHTFDKNDSDNIMSIDLLVENDKSFKCRLKKSPNVDYSQKIN